MRHTGPAWGLVWSGLMVVTVSCGSEQPTGLGTDALSHWLATTDSVRAADSIRVADSLTGADLPTPDPLPGPDTVTGPDTPGGPDTPSSPATPDPGPLPPVDVPRLGIPFGEFHLPANNFRPPYSGALLPLWHASDVAAKLRPARAAGLRVVIALAVAKNLSASKGKFDLVKWKKAVDRFRNADLDPYIADGTIIGHYIIDEPQCKKCWGGERIPHAMIEEMGRYSKSIWPDMPTGMRMTPTRAREHRYRYVDFAWAQWEGRHHVPSYRMTPEEFRDHEIAAAKQGGLGVVFGMNYINGGDGSSGILGDYHNARKVKRFAMSADEVKRVGAVFAAAPYACAVISWKSDGEFLGRRGMKEALAHVSEVARNRPTKSCKP